MAQKYIYRVLRENEITDKGLGEGLYSKSFDINNCSLQYSLGEALDDITTHILNGNKAKTEFISCSTDFCLDLKKYATEQLEKRPYLAVIENHSGSIIDSSKFKYLYDLYEIINEYEKKIYEEEKYELIDEFEEFVKNNPILNSCYKKMLAAPLLFRWKIPKQICLNEFRKLSQLDIEKFVIDASRNIYTDKNYRFFMDNGLIYNKNGFAKENFNQWEYGTAKNSSEVLVLNYIKREDFKILNPLQYDILYCLINNYSIFSSQINSEIIDMLSIFSEENFSEIQKLFDNEVELALFNHMYRDREAIFKIIETTTGFSNLLQFKKRILSKCINYMKKVYNMSYTDIYIATLEETVDLYDNPVVEVKDGKIIRKVKN